VQENVEKPLGWPNEFAIYFDVIAFRRLRAEIRARLTVYRDATCRDQFIAMSARTNASGRKEAIETQDGSYKVKKVKWLQGLRSPYLTL
jgi:hypothetical protein